MAGYPSGHLKRRVGGGGDILHYHTGKLSLVLYYYRAQANRVERIQVM